MCKTVLYFTNQRYTNFAVGNTVSHFGRWIRIADKRLRTDLGDYFEIVYYYM